MAYPETSIDFIIHDVGNKRKWASDPFGLACRLDSLQYI